MDNKKVKTVLRITIIIIFSAIISLCIERLWFGDNIFSKITPISYYVRTFLIFILIVSISLYVFILGRNVKLEKTFLIFGLLFGVMFMLIMPINQIPDEHSHFRQAYKLSNKMLFIYDDSQYSLYMRKCDDSFNSVGSESNIKLYEETINLLNSSYDTTLIKVGTTDMRNFSILYLPSAIAITIARILHLNPVILYMMGRLTNLLIFIFLSYIGLKKMPICKSGFFVILMLPMVMQQAASYSADSILNSVCFTFISYTFYLLYSKEIKTKDFIILTISAALLVPSKAVYFPIILIVALIIKSKFKNTKEHKIAISIFVISIILTFLAHNLGLLTGNFLNGTVTVNGVTILPDGTDGYSKSFLIEKPLEVVKLMFNTVRELRNDLIDAMFGRWLGWFNVNINCGLITIFKMLFLVACFNNLDSEKKHISGGQKLLVIAVICMVIGVLNIAFIITWTHPASNVIQGIQGRYFIPILPLVALLIRNNKLKFVENVTVPIIYSTIILQSLVIVKAYNFIISIY